MPHLPRSSPPERGLVFVVEDDDSVRAAIAELLRFSGCRVETFATSEAFLARPPAEEPACLVLDIELPDATGLELQQQFAESHQDVPIIFVTGHADVDLSVRAMKAGAVEFLTKPFSDVALLAGVERALTRSREVRAQQAELNSLSARYATLTPRERQVMALVVEGLTNSDVAEKLGTRVITVKVQRGSMIRKMQASSLPDLVRMVGKLEVGQKSGALSPSRPAPPKSPRSKN